MKNEALSLTLWIMGFFFAIFIVFWISSMNWGGNNWSGNNLSGNNSSYSMFQTPNNYSMYGGNRKRRKCMK
jgi:hypothetical protein